MTNSKFVLFLRGTLLGAFLFSIASMDTILDPNESFPELTLVGFGIACLVLGYCSVKFSSKFWKTWGFDQLTN
ncbi:MAG: hypothetical protein ABJR05_09165 [Balneola sp.]